MINNGYSAKSKMFVNTDRVPFNHPPNDPNALVVQMMYDPCGPSQRQTIVDMVKSVHI